MQKITTTTTTTATKQHSSLLKVISNEYIPPYCNALVRRTKSYTKISVSKYY